MVSKRQSSISGQYGEPDENGTDDNGDVDVDDANTAQTQSPTTSSDDYDEVDDGSSAKTQSPTTSSDDYDEEIDETTGRYEACSGVICPPLDCPTRYCNAINLRWPK